MLKSFSRQYIFPISLSAISVVSTFTFLTDKSFAVTGFTGAYDPSLWTTSDTTSVSSVSTHNATTLELTLGNSVNQVTSGQFIQRTISIISSQPETLKFDWSFSSLDTAGTQEIGYVINSIYNQLAIWNDTGTINSVSPVTLEVVNGDTFGFRFLATQDTSSVGTFTVNNFSATPVPFETDALPMFLGVSFLGAGVWFKRRQFQKTMKK